jgi:tRNA A37 methylthiotransferase MiaB
MNNFKNKKMENDKKTQNTKNQAVFIETYGCSANQNNSEILAGILSQAGFIITNNQELADIIILNTCIVKEKTEGKIKRRIQDLKSDKNKLIIIAGCMPQTDAQKLKKINENIILLGTHHFKEIKNIIRDYFEKKLDWKKQEDYLSNNNEIKLKLPKNPQNKLISIQQISEGCLGNCSYCKTKLAKGKLFSYPQEEILASIESDLKNGAKEIWLTSQDNAAYGLDRKGKLKPQETVGVLGQDNAEYGLDRGKNEFIELLKKIIELKHKFKLRIGMMNPNNLLPILNELVEIYKAEKVFKFLHIPIQSASNKVLSDMNRHYKIENAEKIITDFRKEIPNIVIATDIIVAYPTETEEDHKKNLEFIKKFKPDVLNISKFSSHKQTEAGKLPVLKNSIIKKRTSELMQMHRITARENKEKYLNKIIKVLVNKKIGDSLHQARDENYNIIFLKSPKEFLGKEVQVKIVSLGVHNMIGELIE